MKSLWKKSVSVLTVIAMAGSMMSASAFAAEPTDETENTDVVEAATDTADEGPVYEEKGEPETDDMMRTLSIQEIAAGQTLSVEISEAGGYVDLYFTAEEDGFYEVFSSTDVYYDTYGYILDEDGNQLYSNDDGGSNNNYYMLWEATAGTTYILRSRMYSSDITGSFSVTVQKSSIDPSLVYSGTSLYIYADEGDSLTLEASAYDYYGNFVDLSEGDYTFAWYKVTNYWNDETEDSAYEVSDVLGTGLTCSIDSLSEDDFYDSDAYVWNYYYCEISRDGEVLATISRYIRDKDTYLNISSDYSSYVSVGDSVTLSLTVRDYNGKKLRDDTNGLTYEWHKVTRTYNSEYGYYSSSEDPEALGTDASYTINSVGTNDFYDYNALTSYYYKCYIYKDGICRSTISLYLYDKDSIYYSPWRSSYVSLGDSVTLEAAAINYDGEEVVLSESDFTFAWYKTYSYTDEDGSYISATSEVLGTSSTYEISAVEASDLYREEAGADTYYNQYQCRIYKDGTLVATSYHALYNKDTYYYGKYESFYQSAGDSVTLEAQVYDYMDELVDLSGDEFTFAWYEVYDYYDQTEGVWNYYYEGLESTGRNFKISSLAEDDFCSYRNDSYNHYMCWIYKNDVQVASCYYYIYDKDYEYGSYYENIYQSSGTLTLEAQAYDYMDESAVLSASGFTFKWYQYINSYNYATGQWTYEASDVLSTARTYTIDSLEDSDLYISSNRQYNYYYCEIYKNGTYVAESVYYIRPEGDTLCLRRGNTFYINYSLKGGNADLSFTFGRTGDEVLIGDWDGDGIDTICVRRGNHFYINNTLTGGDAEIDFTFGRVGDEVLVGDWDGDGKDTLCVRRNGNYYYIDNTLNGGNAETVFTFGRSTDSVLAGDWDYDGYDTLCIRRGNCYYINNELIGGNAEIQFTFGRNTDSVLAGDWDDDGYDTLCIRRGIYYYINNELEGGNAEIQFTFGREGDEVYAGSWQ